MDISEYRTMCKNIEIIVQDIKNQDYVVASYNLGIMHEYFRTKLREEQLKNGENNEI